MGEKRRMGEEMSEKGRVGERGLAVERRSEEGGRWGKGRSQEGMGR